MLNFLITLQAFVADRVERDDKGATAVEYGLLVGLIAVAIILMVGLVGDELLRVFTLVRDELATI